MATVLLPGDNQPVADLPPHNHDNDFVAFRIVEDSEVTRSKFVLGHGIGTQPLDGTGEGRRMVLESGGDCGSQGPLITYGERQKLLLGVLGDRDSERHRSGSMPSDHRTVVAIVPEPAERQIPSPATRPRPLPRG
jgi:hypothetical protein